MISSRPHQKIGIEKPVSEMPITRVVEGRAALDRRHDAGRQADQQGEQHARRPTARPWPGTGSRNSPSTGLRVTIELAEIARAQACPGSPTYCCQQRPVEAELGHQLGMALGASCRARRPSARSGRPGPAGSAMKATKVTPEEGRDQDREPGAEEAQHLSAPARQRRPGAARPAIVPPDDAPCRPAPTGARRYRSGKLTRRQVDRQPQQGSGPAS